MEEHTCPFCTVPIDRIICENSLAFAIYDGFPVSQGHVLIIPKRHYSSLFESASDERTALLDLLQEVQSTIVKAYSPAGFNIGVNDGPVAGQTVMHLHIHLIPRYQGDQEDPRGGVRLIFPNKAVYWEK